MSRGRLILFICMMSTVLLLVENTVQAKPISVNFTATGFRGDLGANSCPIPAPAESVSGTIIFEADSITAPINSLVSIDMTIAGYTYNINEVGFDLQCVNPPCFPPFIQYRQVIGATNNGISYFLFTLRENDFLLSWKMTTPPNSTVMDPPNPFFAYTVPGNSCVYSTSTFPNFSRIEASGNSPPVADAGLGGAAEVGTIAFLDGTKSSDADGDSLTYLWTFQSQPANSRSTISDQTKKIAYFIPDLPGPYVAQLVVNDGHVDSNPSTVQFEAFSTPSAAIESVIGVQAYVSALSALNNDNMKKALINKLNAVIADINAGHYADAILKLKNDVLGKTDGCTKSGSPDENDWIMTCEEQNQVNWLVQETIWIVEPLV